jgi:hypothetical protein
MRLETLTKFCFCSTEAFSVQHLNVFLVSYFLPRNLQDLKMFLLIFYKHIYVALWLWLWFLQLFCILFFLHYTLIFFLSEFELYFTLFQFCCFRKQLSGLISWNKMCSPKNKTFLKIFFEISWSESVRFWFQFFSFKNRKLVEYLNTYNKKNVIEYWTVYWTAIKSIRI